MDSRTEESYLKNTREALGVLQSWGLTDTDIVEIAGLANIVKPRHIDRYRSEKAFPDENDVYQRLDHIVGIDDALQTTYPRNNQMAKMWLNRPHRRFAKKTPMELIMNEGLKGLLSVRMDLDCTYGW